MKKWMNDAIIAIIAVTLWIVIIGGTIKFAQWSFKVLSLPTLKHNAHVEYHKENHQGTYKVCQKCKHLMKVMEDFNKAHTE